MTEDIMPTTEVQAEESSERASYECAFHLLPTVADGEVARVCESIKGIIVEHGGEVFDEEMPQRFTLAYEIAKSAEGRAQRFTNSWFGWVRFTLSPRELERVTVELNHQAEILRHLTIKLTKEEIAHPVRVFESKAESATVVEGDAEGGTSNEVSEADLNKSLEEITT